ncbi:MAG: hypothetical protein PUD03_09850 [Lachnospiraceae bacterium]|nr:hypothetical protein [Lachnospiraceae bacterium]
MTNEEIFEQFHSEKWVIEENLSYLLSMYAEKLGVSNPYSPIAFVKEFMKKETYINTKWAETSILDTLEKNTVITIDSEDINLE